METAGPLRASAFPSVTWGHRQVAPGRSLHILAPKWDLEGPGDSAFPARPREHFWGLMRPETGEEGQAQDDLGDLSPCLTRPHGPGTPAPGRALGRGGGALLGAWGTGARGCCSALGPQGGRGAQAQRLPSAPLSRRHQLDVSAVGSGRGLCPSRFWKAQENSAGLQAGYGDVTAAPPPGKRMKFNHHRLCAVLPRPILQVGKLRPAEGRGWS